MTRATREQIRQLESQVADLQRQLDAALADDSADTALISSLQGQVTVLSTQLVTLNNQAALDDATIADLQAELAAAQQQLADCQAAGGGASFPNVIRPGDSIQAAINDLGTQDVLTLDGAFKSQTVALSHPGMTLQAGPNGASIDFTGSTDGLRGKKTTATWWEDITVKNIAVFGAARSGLVLGRGMTVIGGRFHHCGQNGITGNGDGVPGLNATVRGAEVDHNGATADLGVAGGIKIFEWDGCTFDGVNIHENTGNGQWSDHDCANVKNLGSDIWGNTRRAIFWEKCGRRTDPYDNTKPYNVVYEGPLVVDGCHLHDNGMDAIYAPASCNGIIKNTVFAGNGGAAIRIENDPNRMPPLAYNKPTEPGWFVEGWEVWDSTNTYNGQKVVVGGSPVPPAGAVVRR